MVKLARKNVNLTTHASQLLPRATYIVARQFVCILDSAINILLMPVTATIIGRTTVMQTMTSMMITMPSRGGR